MGLYKETRKSNKDSPLKFSSCFGDWGRGYAEGGGAEACFCVTYL